MPTNANRILHGALAIVKRNGTPVGSMRNISWTEDLRDEEVRGLGTILVQEAPVVAHGGRLTCEFFEVRFKTTGIPGGIRRDVQTKQQFEDNILLRDGIQLDIFKKIEDAIDPDTGLKIAGVEPFAIITNLLINSDGITINEGSVSSHNQTYRFLDPVIYRS